MTLEFNKKQGNRILVKLSSGWRFFIKCRTLYFKSKKTDGAEFSCDVTRHNSHSVGMLSLLSAKLNLQNKVTIVAMTLSRHDEFAQRQAASLHLFDVIRRSIKEQVSAEQVAAPPAREASLGPAAFLCRGHWSRDLEMYPVALAIVLCSIPMRYMLDPSGQPSLQIWLPSQTWFLFTQAVLMALPKMTMSAERGSSGMVFSLLAGGVTL